MGCIFTCAGPMTTKIRQQVHLEKLNHLRLLMQTLKKRHNSLKTRVVVTKLRQQHG